MAAVATRAPGLHLIPTLMEFEDLAQALRLGRADLALTWDLGLEADVTRQTLAHIPPHAVMAADHPLAGRTGLLLRDLADQPLILADQGLSISHMRALFARAGLAPIVAHRAASLDLLRSLAANGLGVGLSYTNPAARLSQDGRALVTRPIIDAGAEAIVLARLTESPPTRGTETLARLLPDLIAPPAFPDKASPTTSMAAPGLDGPAMTSRRCSGAIRPKACPWACRSFRIAVFAAPVAAVSPAPVMVQSRLVMLATPSRTGPAAATQTPDTFGAPLSAR